MRSISHDERTCELRDRKTKFQWNFKGVNNHGRQNKQSENQTTPKGQRTHTRRMKQIAGKDAGITNPQSSPVASVRAHKKQDES